ncbi:adenylate/guanylate cyclase domain-containing protein [Ruegeria arenilitoris]|uniref:adenylate/guanylate cyclase domain-containing protein n=1 Tax=Ruegeria arenilitoris TaxID=1173585 RepID=UPI00147A93E2|nr:adenylate/guanylate cyclase domain-containing protein [Ruegeria arenilitoris]
MQTVEELINWLNSVGRILGDETLVVSHYCSALRELGVPLSRVRIGQNYSNPLISAWGIIWTPKGTQKYTVPITIRHSGAWHGSPFEYVVKTRSCLRKRLVDVDLSKMHEVYRELKEGGATDFLAMPLEYGDGSVQGSSFCTEHADGFSQNNIRTLEATRHALSSALEPIAMRESQRSLLRTYMGDAPAREIDNGNIKRGEHITVSAAILFADLRGFTAKSDVWPAAKLLDIMGDYFDMVVNPIRANGGDVLKFMGDGVLAIFEATPGAENACNSAVEAATQAIANLDIYNSNASEEKREQIEFVIGIDLGEVTFGNIGSPDRLDFTVVGSAVNVASRVQSLCKTLDEQILITSNVQGYAPVRVETLGLQSLKGLAEEVEVFRIRRRTH